MSFASSTSEQQTQPQTSTPSSNETVVNEMEDKIKLVMQQTGLSQHNALELLNQNDNDVVQSICCHLNDGIPVLTTTDPNGLGGSGLRENKEEFINDVQQEINKLRQMMEESRAYVESIGSEELFLKLATQRFLNELNEHVNTFEDTIKDKLTQEEGIIDFNAYGTHLEEQTANALKRFEETIAQQQSSSSSQEEEGQTDENTQQLLQEEITQILETEAHVPEISMEASMEVSMKKINDLDELEGTDILNLVEDELVCLTLSSSSQSSSSSSLDLEIEQDGTGHREEDRGGYVSPDHEG